MTTPTFLTGFEGGVISQNGGGLSESISGTPTIVTSPVHSGTYALELRLDGVSSQYTRMPVSGTPQIGVVRFYLRVNAVASANWNIASWSFTTYTSTAKLNLTVDRQLEMTVGGGTTIHGPTLTLDTWYLVDARLNITGSTWTVDWRVDGTDYTQATMAGQPTNDSITYYRLGSSSILETNGICYFDDYIYSETSGDYPIGAGSTCLIKPNGEGTHSNAANCIEDEAGNDIDGSTYLAYTKINSIPPDTTNYLRVGTESAGKYVEVTLSDMTAGKTPIGVMGFIAYTSATTSTNNAGAVIMDGSNERIIHGGTGAYVDFSDGSLTNLYYKSAIIPVTSLSESNVNALKFRFISGTDANPDPYLIDMWAEVAYAASTSLTIQNAAQTQTIGNVVLTQVHSLTVATASETQTAQNVVLIQNKILTIQNAAQTQRTRNKNVVLDIDHETGNLSQYSSTATDGGDLSVVANAALAGTGYGLQCVIDDAVYIYGYSVLGTKSNIVRYRIYVNPNGVTIDNGGSFTIFYVQNVSDYHAFTRIRLGYASGSHYIRMYIQDDALVESTVQVSITNDVHYIEVCCVRADTDTSSNGFTVWEIDGVPQTGINNIDNYNLFNDANWRTATGVYQFTTTSTGTIYLDEVVLNTDGSKIGPVGQITLKINQSLVVQNAVQGQSIENVVLTGIGSTLTIQNAAQTQTIGNVVLTQVHSLTVATASETQTAQNLSLTVNKILTIQNAAQTQRTKNKNVVLDIDHETGDLSQYSSTVIVSGGLSVTPSSALADTSYGLSVVLNGTNDHNYAIKNFAQSNIYRLRLYFDPNSLPINDGGLILIFKVQQLTTYADIIRIYLVYETATGYRIQVELKNSANETLYTGENNITDSSHSIEINIVQATNSTSSDGIFQWWLDNVHQAAQLGVDNYDEMAIYENRIVVGTLYLSGGYPNGTIYFDEVVLNTDGSKIGPVGQITLKINQSLVVQNAVQGQSIENVVLTGINSTLTIQNVAQAQTVGNVILTQNYTLSITNLAQTQSIANVLIVINKTISITNAAQAQTAGNVLIIINKTVAITNAAQTQATDNTVLTQNHVLGIANLAQVQSIANVLFTQIHVQVVTNLGEVQTIANAVLGQLHNLSPPNLAQVQAVQNITLSQNHNLAIQGENQAQTIDNVVLTKNYNLVLQNTAQSSNLENVVFVVNKSISIQDLAQNQSIEQLVLVMAKTLNINNASSSSSSPNIVLSQEYILTVQTSSQTQTIQNITCVQQYSLVVQNTAQIQSIGSISETQVHNLSIQNCSQTQTLENCLLIQSYILTVQPMAQGQTIGNILLIHQYNLTVQGLSQPQTIEQLVLTVNKTLSITNLAQAQTIGNIVLVQNHSFIIQDSLQSQTVENCALAQVYALITQSLLQTQSTENILFVIAKTLLTDNSSQTQTINNISLLESIHIHPVLDTTVGQWTTNMDETTGLYETINEFSPNDSDYIQSDEQPNNSPVVFAFENFADPDSSEGHVLRYRYAVDGLATINLTVQLRQSYINEGDQGTLIAQWIHNSIGTITTAEQTLSQEQADSITNYSALFIRFVADTE